MSLAVDVAADGVRAPLGRTRAAAIASSALRAENVRNAMLSIAFVTNARIAGINRRHLGRRGATDVISFGFRRPRASDPVVGDIYIAPDVARVHAREVGVRLRDEVARLIVHGVLHVLGYDHPERAGRLESAMWRRQEAILARIATGSPS
ncbi:MAG: rRNA maturation RNase YbeY [Gemmatimonadaceae bacterium]